MHDECTVPIQFAHWQSHGGRMMRWIHENIDTDCYKLRFNSYDPVIIIFNDPTQAFSFRMILALGGNDILGERTTYP